jgi:hypothetical protein
VGGRGAKREERKEKTWVSLNPLYEIFLRNPLLTNNLFYTFVDDYRYLLYINALLRHRCILRVCEIVHFLHACILIARYSTDIVVLKKR